MQIHGTQKNPQCWGSVLNQKNNLNFVWKTKLDKQDDVAININS